MSTRKHSAWIVPVIFGALLALSFGASTELRAEESGSTTSGTSSSESSGRTEGSSTSGSVTLPSPTSGNTAGSIPSILFAAGPGLAVYNGEFSQLYQSGGIGYSLNASIMALVADSPIYAGLDFGMNFWSFNTPNVPPPTSLSWGAVGIQILPSVLYRFTLDSLPKMNPYFGFSAGPNFYVLRKRTVNPAAGTVITNSDTYVYIELLARPGIEYHFNDNIAFNGEAKFGLLNLDLIFLPQVGLTLTL